MKDKAPDDNDSIKDDDYIPNFGGDGDVIVADSQPNDANMADTTSISPHNAKRIRTNKNVSGRWVGTNPNSPSGDF